MRTLILALLCVGVVSGDALAQVAAANPPVRKYKGFCFSHEHGSYKKLPEFVPFKSMQDCLKSGGVVPPDEKKLGH